MSDRIGDYRDPFKDGQNRRLRRNLIDDIDGVARINALTRRSRRNAVRSASRPTPTTHAASAGGCWRS